MWQLVASGEADIVIAKRAPDILPPVADARVLCPAAGRAAYAGPASVAQIQAADPDGTGADIRSLRTTKILSATPRVQRAFEARGLAPNLVLNAIDTDVIKAYVELGLGIAVVADMAFDQKRDRNLRSIAADHLFESNTVYLGFRRNNYLRRYALDFIEMLVPSPGAAKWSRPPSTRLHRAYRRCGDTRFRHAGASAGTQE